MPVTGTRTVRVPVTGTSRERHSFRFVVVRKNLSVERGEHVLFDEVRYFFYVTNDNDMPAEQIVRNAN